MYKTKTPDRNRLKLGTVVVRDTMSQPTKFEFNRARAQWLRLGFMVQVRVRVVGCGLGFRVRGRESAPISICRECTCLLVSASFV